MLTSTKVLPSEDLSASQTTDGYWLDQVYGIAIQAVFAGAPVGTVKLQGSCDHGGTGMPGQPPNQDAVVTWNDIDDSTATVNGAGPVTWNYNGVFYNWIRVVYTRTSGTGSMIVTIKTKGV